MFLPTCAPSHIGLKEKAAVAISLKEEAAAPAETPGPITEGTAHVHQHTCFNSVVLVLRGFLHNEV